MGIKTSQEYLGSLRELKPCVYIAGEKIDNVVDHPLFQTSLKEMSKFYGWQTDPEKREDFTYFSPLIKETVGFWNHLRQSPEELVKLVEVIKKHNARHFCTMCMGIGLSVLWAITYDIDEARGTEYHKRFRRFFEVLQREDLRYCLGVMDPKGDRSMPPSRQKDPDLHLRIVDRNEKGITVNGAKIHTSNAPLMQYFLAMPCRALAEDDRDYAVSFALPIDAPGLSFITRPAPGPLAPAKYENPVSRTIGFVESLSVFDNVFVPWEDVFMCGEWEFTEQLMNYFSPYVRLVKGTCTSARIDILAGAAALAARCNGVEKAGHIRSKITDMMVASEIGWGCVLGSIQQSTMHPSGIPIPDVGISNAGLYNSRTRFTQFMGTIMEIAGGIVTTMPIESEYTNEDLRPIIDKYLKGKAEIPTEERMRILYLIQELTASRWSGYLMSSVICAGGTPETNRVDVARNYDLEDKIRNVRLICEHGC